jgi:hypothetical protein
MCAADLIQLMGVNDVDAPQENVLRDRKLAFQPFF